MIPALRVSLSAETSGLLYGLLGVVAFSITLPATRFAVASLDPVVVGLGRALVAAVCAAILLAIRRQRLPRRHEFGSLLIIAAGVVLGFPLLSAWALREVPAAHGAVIIGLLPLATAVVGAIRGGERPSWLFWLAAVGGSSAVVTFAAITGGGGLHLADLALLGAVVVGAIGYAEGARLARTMGGWQVICWALVIAAPFLSIPVGIAIWQHGLAAPPHAWIAFAYVSLISQWLGFFAWYHGLALGGITRVSQIQLLQPFLTLVAAATLLGEHLSNQALVFAAIVVAMVALGRRAPVGRTTPAAARP
ncbi:MAG TPA: DMT family transporter [Roseiflexaceae bacterium]|nr:DMT family transporter [Roseiflexaceae bacterium]HMP42195.1 DMT family transporter [Roseiflexaceae bacterium]